MQFKLLEILRCPVTRSKLSIKIIKETTQAFRNELITTVEEGILFAEKDWFYPIVKGIPRLCVESFLEYENFLKIHMDDFIIRKKKMLEKNAYILNYVQKKNKRTKASFTKEWSVYNYTKDKTWNAGDTAMLDRFLNETDETFETIKDKIIFDAGCGNGKLNCLLADKGIMNIAMDFSNSIELASTIANSGNVHFIQGDVQFPPVAFQYFNLVHCSGVLIHTNNTELSFSCLTPILKEGGKISIWLYHPRNSILHNLFNFIRSKTSKLPLTIQYYLYAISIFPVSYCIKKLKKNPQNVREMMVDILDWFTPEFRWEHDYEEVKGWFCKRNFGKIKMTTTDVFGFNIVGEGETSN